MNLEAQDQRMEAVLIIEQLTYIMVLAQEAQIEIYFFQKQKQKNFFCLHQEHHSCVQSIPGPVEKI